MYEVFKIGITKSNNQSIKEVKQISLLAGKGIVGDLHFHEYNDARKQLTLIESENIDYYNKNFNLNIPYLSFRRNIITKGIQLNDLVGKKVNQGLTVYGNKGSTDQHAFVQQLRDGTADFFVTFIGVQTDREGDSLEVEPGITSGDFLQGFLLGTREALFQSGRASLTITLEEISPQTLGALIALFERAVGLYASLVGINAYHQPGVEAGKQAAGDVIELAVKIQHHLRSHPEQKFTATELADILRKTKNTETVFQLLLHLAANGRVQKFDSSSPFSASFQAI